MPNSERGGSSEQHAKAGEQGHKNTSGSGSKESGPKGPLAAVRTSSMSKPANCIATKKHEQIGFEGIRV